jgi:hypothetical protein
MKGKASLIPECDVELSSYDGFDTECPACADNTLAGECTPTASRVG